MEFLIKKESIYTRDAQRSSLIEGFILPALQKQTFGDLLKWDPIDPYVFMVQWLHKATSSWSEHNASVFMAWDNLRGRHWEITNKNLVDSKQRLRAALRNNKDIKEVKSLNGYKRYRILVDYELKLNNCTKKKHNIDSRSCKSGDSEPNAPSFKKTKLSKNTCAKCNFHSANRHEFKKHILTHKSVCTTFQCQDCGLCFVSQSSLVKHLRIVHKVDDTLRYIQLEGTNYAPEIENPSEASKRSALECGVCFTPFPNTALLKAHRKSHKISDTLKYIKEDKTNYVTEEANPPEVSEKCSLECEVCDMIFPTESLLKIHKRSHGMAFIKAIQSGLL